MNAIDDRHVDVDTLWPWFIACPFPGVPGMTIERGPRKGECAYFAELMTGVTWYWRCPGHGTIPGELTLP